MAMAFSSGFSFFALVAAALFSFPDFSSAQIENIYCGKENCYDGEQMCSIMRLLSLCAPYVCVIERYPLCIDLSVVVSLDSPAS